MEYGGAGSAGQREGYSRLGIASSVIAVLTTVVVVVLFGTLAQALDAEVSPLLPLGFLGCVLLYLVGLALGVVGAFQRRRKRLFAVIGTILNGLFAFVVVALIFLGLATGG